MAFFTQSALGRLAQSESSGNPSLIHYPSGYAPTGVRSSASGLYGFLDSTWQQYAPKAGVDTSVYPRAYMAPGSVQTSVAAQTPISNWTCPGCNSFATTLARDPANISSGSTGLSITSDLNPGLGSEPGTGLTLNPDGTYTATAAPIPGDPSNPLGIGTPNASPSTGAGFPAMGTGSVINLAGAIGGGLSSVVGAAESWISTALIGFLALILIAGGLFWLAVGSPGKVARQMASARMAL